MSQLQTTPDKQPSVQLRSSDYAITFSFRNSKGQVVTYDQAVVSRIKVQSRTELKVSLLLTEENATDMLFLAQRGKTALVHQLDLFSNNANISTDAKTLYPVITEMMFAVEGCKLTPLERSVFLTPSVELILHLFAYSGIDEDNLVNL